MKKKINISLIIIIFIGSIMTIAQLLINGFMLFLIGYYIYKTNIILSSIQLKPIVEDLDINDYQISELYNYLVFEADGKYLDKTSYMSEEITKDSYSDTQKLIFILNCLNIPNYNDGFKNLEDIVSNKEFRQYYLNQNRVMELSKNVYGDNFKLINQNDEIIYCPYNIRYNDNKYTITYHDNCDKNYTNIGYRRFEKAKKFEDKIIIYDKYFLYNTEDKNVYNSYDKSQIIYDSENGELDLQSDIVKYNLFQKSNYFKHTFKLNDKGNYNWEKSEMTKFTSDIVE